MQIVHQLPHPALTPYVRCYWEITHELAAEEPLDVPFGTTGRTHWLITLHNTFSITFGRGERSSIATCSLHGQLTQPIVKHIRGTTQGLAVDFTATGLYTLWPMSVNELSNRATEMRQVVGPDVEHLTGQLVNTPGASQRFALLDTYLLRRLRVAKTTDGRLEAAVRYIQQRPGHALIREVAHYLNCSERTLNRRFTEAVGVSPKLYARMQRFLQTRRWLELHPQRPWHDVVTAYGYYDQSHLIHEFRAFAGQPPQLYGMNGQPLHDFMRHD